MVEFFNFEKGYWYPHMKPRDIAIWERFIAKYPEAYEKVQYDFAVGDIPPFVAAEVAAGNQRMGELYKLKIDVLGYKDGHIDLIEVKPSATPASIGQLIGYKILYERDAKPTLPVLPMIVTDEEKLNMRMLCDTQGIKLFIV